MVVRRWRIHLSIQEMQRHRFNSWVGKIPWKRKWPLTPAFSLTKSHEQRNLAGYSPWHCKESGMTKHAHAHTHVHTHTYTHTHTHTHEQALGEKSNGYEPKSRWNSCMEKASPFPLQWTNSDTVNINSEKDLRNYFIHYPLQFSH